MYEIRRRNIIYVYYIYIIGWIDFEILFYEKRQGLDRNIDICSKDFSESPSDEPNGTVRWNEVFFQPVTLKLANSMFEYKYLHTQKIIILQYVLFCHTNQPILIYNIVWSAHGLPFVAVLMRWWIRSRINSGISRRVLYYRVYFYFWCEFQYENEEVLQSFVIWWEMCWPMYISSLILAFI